MSSGKEKNLLADIPADQRAKALAEMATSKATEKVRRHYRPDQKEHMKEIVVDEGTKLMEQREEFAKISKTFRQGMKECDEQIKLKLKDLKRGYSENEETVFLMDDQEAGTMSVYDQFGEFLYERKLFPEEKQLTTLQKVAS